MADIFSQTSESFGYGLQPISGENTEPTTVTATAAPAAEEIIMEYPEGVSLATVTTGQGRTMFGEVPRAIKIRVTPVFTGTSHIVWSETSWPFYAGTQVFETKTGEEISFQLPHVDAPGWRDTALNSYTGWHYLARFEIVTGKGGDSRILRYEKVFQLMVGQDSVDLEDIADGNVGEPVSAPTATVTSVDGKTGAVELEPVAVEETDVGVYTIVGAAGEMETLLRSWGIKPEPSFDWAHWGNSMTAAGSSGDWVGKFATAVGHSAYNGGVGGESAAQIHARMTGTPGANYRDRRFTIEVGRNGFKDTAPEVIVDLVHAMIRHLQVSPRGFVFDVPPWEGETTPAAAGSIRHRLDLLNGMLAHHFPDYYLPVYASLRTNEAAVAAGIRFTADDLSDIQSGITPRSFRYDAGHLNAAGGTAVAYFVQKEAQRRQLVTTRPVAVAPNWMVNYATVPDPSVGLGWSGAGNGTIPYSTSLGTWSYQTVTGMDLPTVVRFVGAAGMVGFPEIYVGPTAATRALIPAEGGRFTASLQVRASKAVEVQIRIATFDAAGARVNLWGDKIMLQAGVPQRVSTTKDIPAGVVSANVAVIGAADSLADQSSLEATALMFTKGSTVYPYRDGNSSGWAWDGVAKQSTSTGLIPA